MLRECSLVKARLVRAIRTRGDLIDGFGDERYLRIGKAYRGPVCCAQRETKGSMAALAFFPIPVVLTAKKATHLQDAYLC